MTASPNHVATDDEALQKRLHALSEYLGPSRLTVEGTAYVWSQAKKKWVSERDVEKLKEKQ